MIFGFIFILLLPLTQATFCFSQCSDNTTCAINNAYNCTTCTSLISVCGTTNLGLVLLQSADGSNMTSANNYIATKNTSYSCSWTYNVSNTTSYNLTYNFVSQLVSTDYIYKNYSIPKPHYSITIRMSMAYVGVWSSADYLQLVTYDGIITNSYLLNYNCTNTAVNYTENLCNVSRYGNHKDCVIFYNYKFSSNTSFLLLNFSSLTFQKDPLIQFWSPFDINIAYSPCDSSCSACYGPSNADCTACVSGSVLTNNNTCLSACPGGTILLPAVNDSTTGICVSTCPQGYYSNGSTCLSCSSGCLSCMSSGFCLVYNNQSDQSSTVWRKYIALWVILIILGIMLLGGLIYKLVFVRKQLDQQQQRIVSEVNESRPNEEVTIPQQAEAVQQANHIHVEEIDFNDNVRMSRKRKRQQRDLNRVANSVFI